MSMVSVARMLVSLSLKTLSKRSGSISGVATGICCFSERPSNLAETRKTDLLLFSLNNNFDEMSEFLAAAIFLR